LRLFFSLGGHGGTPSMQGAKSATYCWPHGYLRLYDVRRVPPCAVRCCTPLPAPWYCACGRRGGLLGLRAHGSRAQTAAWRLDRPLGICEMQGGRASCHFVQCLVVCGGV